jgi:hypothetical protein
MNQWELKKIFEAVTATYNFYPNANVNGKSQIWRIEALFREKN